MSPKLKGTVRWFDKLSGRGSIRGADGNSYWVFACNITGSKSLFEHLACMYLEANQEVEFEIIPGAESCGACNVSNGIFDQESWDSIKNKDFAFTQNEAGEMSGLFKRGAR